MNNKSYEENQEIVCFIISNGLYNPKINPSVKDSNDPLFVLQQSQKEIWSKYMNINPRIKSYFIEYDENLTEDFKEDEDTIYFKGQESIIPGIFIKRQKAINFALKNFKNLKYIIQTNLSSFFIWDKMLNLLPANPPKYFLMGKKWSGFPSGCGTIYAKDVCELISSSPIDPSIEHDDCTIGKVLLHNNIHHYDGYYHMSYDLEKVPFHCYHLRSRIDINISVEERIDREIPYLKKALEKYYDETV
jgi:hypothetical protein